MKKNFKVMAMVAMAAVIGMSSCSSENDKMGGGIDNGETTSVSIMLTETSTRTVTAPIAQVAVNFKSGYVIFTNSLGIINKVTEITETNPSDAEKATGAKVWINDLKTIDVGGQIKNVPAAANKVYIIGNLPLGVTAPVTAENISSVQNRVITVASQSNTEGSVANVTLYGDGVTLTAHTIPGTKYAKVNVNAIAARVEIGRISYKNTLTNLVTGFRVDGIYINYYYPEMSLASVVSTTRINNAPANNTAADAMYTTAVGGNYNSDATKVLCDFNATTGLGYNVSDISKSAADPDEISDKNVWAYNVLAPLSVYGTSVTKLEAPHVVIRLSNVKTSKDGMDGAFYKTTQYLTVREFRDINTKEPISSFKPGYIYYINDLTFDESNLTDIPEQEAVTVYVEAKLMTWNRQEVEWGF